MNENDALSRMLSLKEQEIAVLRRQIDAAPATRSDIQKLHETTKEILSVLQSLSSDLLKKQRLD